ncbi:hypothetical protein C7C46_21760 [Streptomyces tateyamensis]|uniref:DUF11 domain-containing protein n=1 Tax=Streptomyces tateyamensis TaxID=565073 RepID=A0A2V4NCF5_9ACTN|nr:DUF11 domain-containing protein [Streptomyces tateyamensis]PYC76810.1 hypothetical protein C7C46_21760 [Streptomyces tateyamensis]
MKRNWVLALPLAGALVLAAPAAAAAPRATGADLFVVQLEPDPVAPGGTTTVHAFVANKGPGPAGEFTVTVRVPAGARAVGPYFPDNCRADEDGRRVRCTFGAGLPPQRTATALVPVQVSDEASGTLRGGRVTVHSSGDPDPANDSASYVIQVS